MQDHGRQLLEQTPPFMPFVGAMIRKAVDMQKPPWLQQIISTVLSVVIIGLLGWVMGIPALTGRIDTLTAKFDAIEKKVDSIETTNREWVGRINGIAEKQARAIGEADAIHRMQDERLKRLEGRR